MRRLDTIVVTVLAVAAWVLLPACMREAPPRPAAHPSEVEPLEGTDVALVTLTSRAVERLGIVTVPLTTVDAAPTRIVVGSVVPVPPALVASGAGAAAASAATSMAVSVELDDADRRDLDLEDDATLVSLGRMASPAAGTEDGLVYLVQGGDAGLPVGQRVQLEIPVAAGGGVRSVVPYSALLYDVHGDAWVYVSDAPGAFRRAPVVVEAIEGELAILLDGPEVGTPVVSVGAAELFGTEYGVGH